MDAQLLRMWVFEQYGAAMLTAQAFELSLASLVLTVELRPSDGGRRLSGQRLERELRLMSLDPLQEGVEVLRVKVHSNGRAICR
jgi:hypothetical protein